MRNTLVGLVIHVSDVDRCREFYEALGLVVGKRSGILDADFIEMMIGDVTVVMRPADAFMTVTTGMTLVVAVDDRPARLRAALATLDPVGTFSGYDNENIVLSDPDGRTIRLVSNASNEPHEAHVNMTNMQCGRPTT